MDKNSKRLTLEPIFNNRFNIIKEGKLAQGQKNFSLMVHKYHEYLNIFAELLDCTIFDLTPEIMPKSITTAEKLLISQVCWELAKVFDRSPGKEDDVKKCLNLFTRFTVNQSYQIANSEVLRKEIKRERFKNKLLFENAYKKIFKDSKKCFIATFCWGNDHPLTNDFRLFKEVYLHNQIGYFFIENYYLFSQKLILHLSQPRWYSFFMINFLIIPILHLIRFFFIIPLKFIKIKIQP